MSRSLVSILGRSFVACALSGACALSLVACQAAPPESDGDARELEGDADGDDAAPEQAPSAAGEIGGAVARGAELARMKEHLDSRYRPSDVRHAFKLPSGDAIDCVDIDRQPALRGAATAGRPVASPPPAALAAAGEPPPFGEMEAFLRPGTLNAEGVEMACPEGTVPIRRVDVADFARFRTIEDRFRKHAGDAPRTGAEGHVLRGPATAIEAPEYGPSGLHQYAHASHWGLANIGAHVTINVWNPYVEMGSEFSLGQLWVVAGGGSNLQTLEAGAQKYPNLYGTWQPHLFIYSTSDGYGSQGCYNLDCGRFVQVNGSVVIGGQLTPVSTSGGQQYEIELAYYLWQGNWWLSVSGVWVGYYPGSLFNAAGLANGATVIDFGGEIIDDRSAHGWHTQTDMGSGAYPASWFGWAGYMRQIWYWTSDGAAYWATGLGASRDSAACYDVALYHNDPNWGTYLFYGGPGYNSACQ